MRNSRPLSLVRPLGLGIALWSNFASPVVPASAAPATTVVSTPPVIAVKPVQLWAPVQDKNFYLLSLCEHTPGVPAALASNDALKKLTASQTAKLTAGFKGGTITPGSIETFVLSDADIDTATGALRDLYRTNSALKAMVDGPLRQSGMYERYNPQSGEELLAHAWHDAAAGINHMVQVYGLGQPPRYPKIDSPFYDVKTPFYGELTNIIFGTLAEDDTAHQLFFQPSMRVALALLDANRRDEAARFEPMESGENAAAFKRIGSISWTKYPYSLILVPGQGPEEAQVELSPKAKLVLSAVARRYKEGKAPLIVVSGGYVHPSQTPFCEAIEMKHSLMNDFGVPENAILIDPHARHTTTNLRNTARLIYRYGIPPEKMALITTTPAQSRTIERASFAERCTRELGYVPMQRGKRPSPFDLEFRPLPDSLQIDPTDPLDP